MIVKINAAATNAASTVSSSVSMPRGLDTSRAPCPDDHVGSTVTSSPDMVFFAAISGGAATGTGAAATCARSITRVCDSAAVTTSLRRRRSPAAASNIAMPFHAVILSPSCSTAAAGFPGVSMSTQLSVSSPTPTPSMQPVSVTVCGCGSRGVSSERGVTKPAILGCARCELLSLLASGQPLAFRAKDGSTTESMAAHSRRANLITRVAERERNSRGNSEPDDQDR
eukprot:scaffold22141_cov64-Phaeocystis_antarctica.AAC.4